MRRTKVENVVCLKMATENKLSQELCFELTMLFFSLTEFYQRV